MIDIGEVVALSGIVLTGGLIVSGFAGAWLHGRSKGRREGMAEAQQLLASTGGPSIQEQNERIDSLMLEVTRLRENQSQMSRVLRVAVQARPVEQTQQG